MSENKKAKQKVSHKKDRTSIDGLAPLEVFKLYQASRQWPEVARKKYLDVLKNTPAFPSSKQKAALTRAKNAWDKAIADANKVEKLAEEVYQQNVRYEVLPSNNAPDKRRIVVYLPQLPVGIGPDEADLRCFIFEECIAPMITPTSKSVEKYEFEVPVFGQPLHLVLTPRLFFTNPNFLVQRWIPRYELTKKYQLTVTVIDVPKKANHKVLVIDAPPNAKVRVVIGNQDGMRRKEVSYLNGKFATDVVLMPTDRCVVMAFAQAEGYELTPSPVVAYNSEGKLKLVPSYPYLHQLTPDYNVWQDTPAA